MLYQCYAQILWLVRKQSCVDNLNHHLEKLLEIEISVLIVSIKVDDPDSHNYHYICCVQGSFLQGSSAQFIWISNIKTTSAERTD